MSENVVQLKCLNCEDQSATVFHEIFDEIGTELQLHKYLEQFFRLQILPLPGATKQQVLCDDCINQLIELIDLEECNKDIESSIEQNDLLKEISDQENDNYEWEAEDQFAPKEEDDQSRYPLKCMEKVLPYREEPNNGFKLEYVDEYDIDSYLDASINVDLTSFEIAWSHECKVCGVQLLSYKEALHHMRDTHNTACTICEHVSYFGDLNLLSRHLMLMHANFSSLQIYTNCPHCNISFSDFGEFNKHSCSRRLVKWRPGLENRCKHCNVQCRSFKRYLFHHQFHLPSHRPAVCLICRQNFSNDNDLFEHVNYEHKTEETFSCLLCDRTFKQEELFLSHTRRHQTRKFKCEKCSMDFGHRHLYLNHLHIHHTDKPWKRTCKVCGKLFPNQQHYLNHIRQQHFSKADVKVYLCSNCRVIGRDKDEIITHIEASNGYCDGASIDDDIISTVYTCEYCSKDFKLPNDLKLHRIIGTHQNGMYDCHFCHKSCDSRKKLLQHMKLHPHYDDWLTSLPLLRLFLCDEEDCDATFPNWSALNYHKRRCHNPLTCSLCKTTFRTVAEFDDHQSTCSTLFKCQICGKLCPTKMSLAVHVGRTHNNKRLMCPHCKSTYKSDELLQEHIDSVHVPQECTHCHKVMKNKRNLKIHWRVVHKSEHRYFCSECEKGFFHRNEMEMHKKTIHSGVVYRCSECNFTTMYAKSLDVHMAMHKDELTFTCPVCDRKFARKQVMNVHIRRHQVDRQFRCSDYILNGCSASFITHYLLKKHISEKHNQAKRKRRVGEKSRGRKRKIKKSNDFDYDDFLKDADDPLGIESNTMDVP